MTANTNITCSYVTYTFLSTTIINVYNEQEHMNHKKHTMRVNLSLRQKVVAAK